MIFAKRCLKGEWVLVVCICQNHDLRDLDDAGAWIVCPALWILP